MIVEYIGSALVKSHQRVNVTTLVESQSGFREERVSFSNNQVYSNNFVGILKLKIQITSRPNKASHGIINVYMYCKRLYIYSSIQLIL